MKKTIYLFKSGELHKEHNTLVLVNKDKEKLYIPIEQINLIICFKDITINTKALSLLNKYKISIYFLNYYGSLIGKYIPKDYLDGKALIEQVHAYSDESKRNYIAKIIITSSLKNCISLLKYYDKTTFNLSTQIEEIKKIIKLFNHKSVSEMLLLEARAKKIYYSCFDVLLEDSGYMFVKRSTRPPTNEINALLSFGYSVLYSKILSIIDRSKLVSQISFIHSLSKRNESLQFDLADIVKPYIIDRLVLRLCRRNYISKDYFSYDDKKCYLNEKGCKWFVKQLNDYLEKTIRVNGKYYSYQGLLYREVTMLTNYLLGKQNYYHPYIMKW